MNIFRSWFIKRKYKPYMADWERDLIVTLLQELNPKRLLEWGSGYSTLYFPCFLKGPFEWVSIEHDESWYHTIKNKFRSDTIVHLIPPNQFPFSDEESDGTYSDLHEYVDFPKSQKSFDWILVDGRARSACIKAAKDCLGESGVVVLHDANRESYHAAFSDYKYQKFYPSDTKDAGGIWLGSNTLDIAKLTKGLAFERFADR